MRHSFYFHDTGSKITLFDRANFLLQNTFIFLLHIVTTIGYAFPFAMNMNLYKKSAPAEPNTHAKMHYLLPNCNHIQFSFHKCSANIDEFHWVEILWHGRIQ